MRRDRWESPDLLDLREYQGTPAGQARVARRDPPVPRAHKADLVSPGPLDYLDFLVREDFPASLECLD